MPHLIRFATDQIETTVGEDGTVTVKAAYYVDNNFIGHAVGKGPNREKAIDLLALTIAWMTDADSVAETGPAVES
jgi:hypothetical protein